ncbi:MAG: peptidase U32 family protein, partial [Porcipelethomonas sp.]
MNKFDDLEVLAPAGDAERFRSALDYGADAVYLGAKKFGMRASPGNFTFDELKTAVEQAHEKGVKVYLTCNTLPRNDEIPGFEEFIKNVQACGTDAVIVADLGLLSLIKQY